VTKRELALELRFVWVRTNTTRFGGIDSHELFYSTLDYPP
jgi:hypothetical protein